MSHLWVSEPFDTKVYSYRYTALTFSFVHDRNRGIHCVPASYKHLRSTLCVYKNWTAHSRFLMPLCQFHLLYLGFALSNDVWMSLDVPFLFQCIIISRQKKKKRKGDSFCEIPSYHYVCVYVISSILYISEFKSFS